MSAPDWTAQLPQCCGQGRRTIVDLGPIQGHSKRPPLCRYRPCSSSWTPAAFIAFVILRAGSRDLRERPRAYGRPALLPYRFCLIRATHPSPSVGPRGFPTVRAHGASGVGSASARTRLGRTSRASPGRRSAATRGCTPGAPAQPRCRRSRANDRNSRAKAQFGLTGREAGGR
jgi:hypothetical protein